MQANSSTLAILYGTTTGDTERVAELIAQNFRTYGFNPELHDVAFLNPKQLKPQSLYLFGISTWYYGDMQSDWECWASHLAELTDWQGCQVGLFGCGDQEAYGEYFCDAIGKLYRRYLEPLKVHLIGKLPLEGYRFTRSEALESEGESLGLMLDEHHQPELTSPRIQNWCQNLLQAWKGGKR